MRRRFVRLMVGLLVAAASVLLVPSVAAAGYRAAAPKFDQLMVLRTVEMFNVIKPSAGEECDAVGRGAISNVSQDHPAWVRDESASSAFHESLDAIQTTNRWCDWVSSDAAREAVPGVEKLFDVVATERFSRLRKALRRDRCGRVVKLLDVYPAVPGRILDRTLHRVGCR